ncbi:MAG TPA: hypothetical protein VG938_05525 [Verrucomicrobiae bacterium]|jgi:hypothetical protein|nr:hypothetical protein [Verrucomicrobiae bacterium]
MKCSFWLGLLLFITVSASALEVQQARWGFDGQVVPGRFNLLSVLVANNSAAPFDGSMSFYKSRGLEQRVGAIYATPCYLSPLASRWLQFYVFIDNQYDQWRLEWGRGPDDHHDVDSAKWGFPAQVLLADSDTVSAISAFRQFPDELFPPTVAATGGLDSLLLDHVPRWEPAKRRAFLEWLQAGGKVHVLKGADGRYPVFTDELSVLNSSEDRTRIGLGVAVRHAATAAHIQKQDVDSHDAGKKSKLEDTNTAFQTTNTLLGSLSRLSRARLEWGLIYLLAIVYLGFVGPGNFLMGRRLADYRLRIAVLVATVAGFALLFNFVGRRGQSEASVVHTLSYARVIDGDTYDVMQWINVFAARGGHYTITHSAPHNIYSTGQDYESVNGWIESGKDGRFIVDMPMFSRRGLLHEAEMKGADIGVKIVDWTGAKSLKKLTLSAQPDFTKQILDGWVVQGDQIYAMTLAGGQIEFEDSRKQPLSSSLSPSGQQQPSAYAYANNPYAADPTDADVEQQFRKLAKPLIAWSLGISESQPQSTLPQAVDGRVQLFLFARSPQSFGVAGGQFGREIGYVLYRLDLFKPGP